MIRLNILVPKEILNNSLFCFLRSRDRPVLVRGAWGETHRAIREEAQLRRGSGQRGDEAFCQDAAAAAQQP